MAKVFRPSTREASILSKIESTKEHARRQAINSVRDHIDTLSNAVTSKLVENKFVETTNKNGFEEQIHKSLDKLTYADDFDIDYQTAPYRNIVPNPHVVSLYLTSYVIETMINHKDVIDIFGADDEIYHCINRQVQKHLT